MKVKEKIITFHSRNGHLIRVRPLGFDDAPLLVNIFEHMTPDSRYRRFHQSLDHVHPHRIQQEAINIAQADSDNNWGLIAFTDLDNQPDVPVGAVRLVRTAPLEAEVAISIRDDLQNQGIGTQLMHMLAETARDIGLERLVADIQNDNPAIWHVFNNLPFAIQRQSEGVYSHLIISLNSEDTPVFEE